MTNRKSIGKRILTPPPWLVAVLTCLSTLSLLWVMWNELDKHPIAYPIYVIAFYSLTVLTIFCITKLPTYLQNFKKRLFATKYGKQYATDPIFRARMALYFTLTLNSLYVGGCILFGMLTRSAWFYVLAIYYAMLSIMRFLLVRFLNRHPLGQNAPEEWRRSRLCALILTLITPILSGAILMILYREKGFVYQGVLIYVVALYCFYALISAIVRLVRYRRHHSPVLSMSKFVELSSALVSMLALETAMLSAFGTELPPSTRYVLIAVTGAVISLIMLTMSFSMIICATKKINYLKQENSSYARK